MDKVEWGDSLPSPPKIGENHSWSPGVNCWGGGSEGAKNRQDMESGGRLGPKRKGKNVQTDSLVGT